MSYSPFPPAFGAPAAAAPADALQMGGTDGTDLRALSTDSSGRLLVVEYRSDGLAAPVGAKIAGISPAAAVNGNLIAAVAGHKFLLTMLSVSPSAVGTGGGWIDVTVGGMTIPIVFSAAGAGPALPGGSILTFPRGLLCDTNTNVTYNQVAGGGSTYIFTAVYDQI